MGIQTTSFDWDAETHRATGTINHSVDSLHAGGINYPFDVSVLSHWTALSVWGARNTHGEPSQVRSFGHDDVPAGERRLNIIH